MNAGNNELPQSNIWGSSRPLFGILKQIIPTSFHHIVDFFEEVIFHSTTIFNDLATFNYSVQFNNDPGEGIVVNFTNPPTCNLDPTAAEDLATKNYVDSVVAGGGVDLKAEPNIWTRTNEFQTDFTVSGGNTTFTIDSLGIDSSSLIYIKAADGITISPQTQGHPPPAYTTKKALFETLFEVKNWVLDLPVPPVTLATLPPGIKFDTSVMEIDAQIMRYNHQSSNTEVHELYQIMGSTATPTRINLTIGGIDYFDPGAPPGLPPVFPGFITLENDASSGAISILSKAAAGTIIIDSYTTIEYIAVDHQFTGAINAAGLATFNGGVGVVGEASIGTLITPSINAEGTLHINSAGLMALNSEAVGLTINSTHDMTIDTGAALNIVSGLEMDLASGLAMNINSDVELGIAAGTALNLASTEEMGLVAGTALNLGSGFELGIVAGTALNLGSGEEMGIASGGVLNIDAIGLMALTAGAAISLATEAVITITSVLSITLDAPLIILAGVTLSSDTLKGIFSDINKLFDTTSSLSIHLGTINNEIGQGHIKVGRITLYSDGSGSPPSVPGVHHCEIRMQGGSHNILEIASEMKVIGGEKCSAGAFSCSGDVDADGTIKCTHIFHGIEHGADTVKLGLRDGDSAICNVDIHGNGRALLDFQFIKVPTCSISAIGDSDLCNRATVVSLISGGGADVTTTVNTWTQLNTYDVLPVSTVAATTDYQFCNRTTVESLIMGGGIDIRTMVNTWTNTNNFSLYVPTCPIGATGSNDLCNKATVLSLISGGGVDLRYEANVWHSSNSYLVVLPTSIIVPYNPEDLTNKAYVDAADGPLEIKTTNQSFSVDTTTFSGTTSTTTLVCTTLNAITDTDLQKVTTLTTDLTNLQNQIVTNDTDIAAINTTLTGASYTGGVTTFAGNIDAVDVVFSGTLNGLSAAGFSELSTHEDDLTALETKTTNQSFSVDTTTFSGTTSTTTLVCTTLNAITNTDLQKVTTLTADLAGKGGLTDLQIWTNWNTFNLPPVCIVDPTAFNHAARKQYVDNADTALQDQIDTLDIQNTNQSFVTDTTTFSGTTSTTTLVCTTLNAITDTDLQKVTTLTADLAGKGGISTPNAWTGTNTFNTSAPSSTVTPTSDNDLTRKKYVDDQLTDINTALTEQLYEKLPGASLGTTYHTGGVSNPGVGVIDNFYCQPLQNVTVADDTWVTLSDSGHATISGQRVHLKRANITLTPDFHGEGLPLTLIGCQTWFRILNGAGGVVYTSGNLGGSVNINMPNESTFTVTDYPIDTYWTVSNHGDFSLQVKTTLTVAQTTNVTFTVSWFLVQVWIDNQKDTNDYTLISGCRYNHLRNCVAGVYICSGGEDALFHYPVFYSTPELVNLLDTNVGASAFVGQIGTAVGSFEEVDVNDFDDRYLVLPGWGLISYANGFYGGNIRLNFYNDRANPVYVKPTTTNANSSLKIFFRGQEILPL